MRKIFNVINPASSEAEILKKKAEEHLDKLNEILDAKDEKSKRLARAMLEMMKNGSRNKPA